MLTAGDALKLLEGKQPSDRIVDFFSIFFFFFFLEFLSR